MLGGWGKKKGVAKGFLSSAMNFGTDFSIMYERPKSQTTKINGRSTSGYGKLAEADFMVI